MPVHFRRYVENGVGRKALTSAQEQLQAFERHGADFLVRLTAAVKEESWKLRLLALGWTAGPVTYFALLAGFTLGYGKPLPRELFIYFAAYTVVAGIISLLAGVVKRATVTAKRRTMEKMLSEVIAKIPDLILSIRNLSLSLLTPEQRRIQGAVYLLSDPDASEASIETAVEDLTGSRQLARGYRRLESYRRKGLWELVNTESRVIEKNFDDLLGGLGSLTPHAVRLLKNRGAGWTPSKRLGQRRRYGFFGRLIEAVDTGDPEAMNPADIEELLKIILELLLDRRFVVIRWQLAGDHPLVQASRRLEKARRHRHRLERKIRLEKYEVLRLLDKILNLRPPPSETAGTDGPMPCRVGAPETCVFTMAEMPDFSDPEALFSARGLFQRELRERVTRLSRLTGELANQAAREKAAAESFYECRGQYRQANPVCLDAGGEAPVGVRFEREALGLDNEDKIRFARQLHGYLAALTTNRERTRLLFGQEGDADQEMPRPLTVEELKSIVLRIFAQFERLLDLSQPAVIDSLEASAAINVSNIEYTLSRRTKIGWLQVLLEDMEENEGQVALRTAERLVSHTRCRLPERVAVWLAARYKLPPEQLRELRPKAEES